MGERFVIVGCGKAKREPELVDGQLRVRRWPAKELYTSTYFAKKGEYGEVVGDQWMILSAEHGLLPPDERIEPYETSIDDLDEEELDRLAHAVGMELVEWVAWEQSKGVDVDEIVVLAGRRYLESLRDREAFYVPEARVIYPFQQLDLGGIGEQMAWLTERVKAEDAGQALLADGGDQG